MLVIINYKVYYIQGILFELQLTGEIKDLRVGLVKEGFDISEKDVNDLVRKSAERLSEKGAVVEDVSIPWHLDGNLECKIKLKSNINSNFKCILKSLDHCHRPFLCKPISAS